MAALNRPVGRREILLAAAVGAALVALAVVLLRAGEAPRPAAGMAPPAPPPAEAVQPGAAADAAPRAPAAPAPPAVAPAPDMATPAPAGSPPVQAPDVPAAGAQAGQLAGLKLRGVLGGAAILELPGGRQRLVRLGRAVVPGVALAAVGPDHVLLEAGGQRLRLVLGDAGGITPQAPTAAAAPAPRAAAGPVIPGLADAAREAGRAYQLGLRPVEVNGRTTGYRVMPGVRMPGLAEAGLQPGDVIRMVNGMDFTDEERVEELGAEIAGSYEFIVEFERGGQRLTRTVAVNPRPATSGN